jgi:hypothetical protein
MNTSKSSSERLKKHFRRLPALTFALLVAGCATYSLIEPKRTAVGDLYTVEPQIRWSATRVGGVEIWTVDGPSLQAIRFLKGLRDGDPLFEGKTQAKRPQFKKDMSASDIMEFVVDSLSVQGSQKIATRNLRPAPFGNNPGFRFEMSFVSREGLDQEALVEGAVIAERLHLIIYSGARAHYFPKYKPEIERLIESIRMP